MTAFERLCELRWPDGIRCPHCGHGSVYPIRTRGIFVCASKLCRRQFSPTTGTIFRYRKMSPEQYVRAIEGFPACAAPCDMQRALGVDYRTAFNIFRALKSTEGKLL